MHIIYKHTCKITNLSYIGHTTVYDNMTFYDAMLNRLQQHIEDTIKNNSQFDFHKAIREFGKENFEHEIIEQNIQDMQEACLAEIYWIKWYNTKTPYGYNMTDGGEGVVGFKPTKEQCLNISKLTRQAVSHKIDKCDINGNVLITYDSLTEASQLSGVYKHAISRCCNGYYNLAGGYIWKYHDKTFDVKKWNEYCLSVRPRKQLKKTKKLISDSSFKRPVSSYDFDGNFCQNYDSIINAYKQTNINYSSIVSCCYGKYKFAGKYQWKFTDDDKIMSKLVLNEKHHKGTIYEYILQYDLNEKFLNKWNTLREISQSCNVPFHRIQHDIKHGSTQSGFILKAKLKDKK